jgi:hypothetical protein
MENRIASNSIDFSKIEAVGNNGLFNVAANVSGFNKSAILTFMDKQNVDYPLPNPFCFNNKGKELQVDACYGTLPAYMSLLCSDNANSVRTRWHYSIEASDRDIHLRERLTLHDFLQKHEIVLLNNQRLDESMLPKSTYYLFVDWFFWTITATDVLVDMDSIANINKEKITLVLIHATNPDVLVKTD